MKSLVAKRSIVIAGHKTSVSLEEPFWLGLKNIAQGQETTLSHLVETIDVGRNQGNLSSALRLFVLERFRATPIVLSAPSGGRATENKLNGSQHTQR